VAGDTNGLLDVFEHDRQTATTARVSVDGTGGEATNGGSSAPALSGDGRYVAFMSGATNLVAGDTNDQTDIFVHDRETAATTRVSIGSGGVQADGSSLAPSINGDGRFVAFRSAARNLVPSDTSEQDVFVHDRTTGLTTLESASTGGAHGNGFSFGPSLSADGRFLAFGSAASNLVPGDTNGGLDVFVRNREEPSTFRASVGGDGSEAFGPYTSGFWGLDVTPDGRHVAFTSFAANLVAGDTNGLNDVFVHDLQTGATTRASIGNSGTQGLYDSSQVSISADGRYVAFVSLSDFAPPDNNFTADVFVRDLQAGTTTRASVSSSGTEANAFSFAPSLSADGRYVGFESSASNLVAGDTNGVVDVFVHDLVAGTTTRVTAAHDGAEPNGPSGNASISANGRYVAFLSRASNLVAGDTNGNDDIFVRDVQTGATTRESVSSTGAQATNGTSYLPSISADGRYVAFESSAWNLDSVEVDSDYDIFLRDRQTGETSRASVGTDGAEGNGESLRASIAPDGQAVAFYSFASNLVESDTNEFADAFIYDIGSGLTSRVSVASGGKQSNGTSEGHLSLGTDSVAFFSHADNLVSGDTNAVGDAFVHRLASAPVSPSPPPVTPPPPLPSPPPSPPVTPSPPAVVTPPAVVRCVVPDVRRRTVVRARRLLALKRCRLGHIKRAYSIKVKKGAIISQSRQPGARLAGGTPVNVVVSRGRRRTLAN
jgi:Tol biopolymer transport system component